MNIQAEKQFIQSVDKKVRELEIEKARLEQSRENAQKKINETLELMSQKGYTPDNISEGIAVLKEDVTKLKQKITAILNNTDGGNSNAAAF